MESPLSAAAGIDCLLIGVSVALRGFGAAQQRALQQPHQERPGPEKVAMKRPPLAKQRRVTLQLLQESQVQEQVAVRRPPQAKQLQVVERRAPMRPRLRVKACLQG